MDLILASSSPYRHALLSRLQVPFTWRAPEVDENPLPGEKPEELALRLSSNKAQALAEIVKKSTDTQLIIGSDQVASYRDQCINKPGNYATAFEQLKSFSGHSVNFYSGLCVLNSQSGQSIADTVTTQVLFRTLSDRDINTYLRREEPYDCAGSFKAEGLGIALFDAINSNDSTAIIGLPLIRLRQMLEHFDYRILEYVGKQSPKRRPLK